MSTTVISTEDRQMHLQKGEAQERLAVSLDKLEQKYEQALMEWERLATTEKQVSWPTKRSKRLPKRLPKLGVLSVSSDNGLPEQAIREHLVQVLGKCRTEEVIIRALERTLEDQTKNLESERSQQHLLQQQLQTILHEKEELQKLTRKAKMHSQRVAPLVENAERRLADNSERLRKIDGDIMKIRRNAVELLQINQARNEVEGQVEALSSSITALQEQKAAALQRMRHSQAEEVKHYHSMKAAIKQVCVQHSENILVLDGRYEVLWSNVDHLLDCCSKLLQLTRPEVEALKVGTHHQTVKSSGAELNVVCPQADTRGNKLTVTCTGGQPDVQVSDSQVAVQGMLQNDSVSSESQFYGTHGEVQLLGADTGDGNSGQVLCGPITAEGHAVGGSVAANEQMSEPADVQLSPTPQNQTLSETSKHSAQHVFVVKSSAVLTHAGKTLTLGNSSSMVNDVYYRINIVTGNDQTLTSKIPVSDGCHICHVEEVTINEPTFPFVQEESSVNKDIVLIVEEVDAQIRVCVNQTENSPVATELQDNITTTADSLAVRHLPHNVVIVVTEGKPLHALSLVSDTLN